MLDVINQGTVTISINGKPILSLDRDSKSLGLEASGLEEGKLKISNLFKTKNSKGRIFLESSSLMKKSQKRVGNFLYMKKVKRFSPLAVLPDLVHIFILTH